MSRTAYIKLLHELLSGDPERVREANRTLYVQVVQDSGSSGKMNADLALVESTGPGLRGGV